MKVTRQSSKKLCCGRRGGGGITYEGTRQEDEPRGFGKNGVFAGHCPLPCQLPASLCCFCLLGDERWPSWRRPTPVGVWIRIRDGNGAIPARDLQNVFCPDRTKHHRSPSLLCSRGTIFPVSIPEHGSCPRRVPCPREIPENTEHFEPS